MGTSQDADELISKINLPMMLVGNVIFPFSQGEDFEEDDVLFFQIVVGMLITRQLHDWGGVLNGFCFGEHINLGKFHLDLFPLVGGHPKW